MSRISILNASVKDFAIEALTKAEFEALDNVSGHANGRMVKSLKADGTVVFYIWDDTASAWTEFSPASDITALSTQLSTVASQHVVDEASLETADATLSQAIADEATARAAAVAHDAHRRG